jgi:hypothetical protein
MSAAFDELLRNLPDLVLDTPDAATVLANFLARAVADDCLPPRYVIDLEALTKIVDVEETPLKLTNGHVAEVEQNGTGITEIEAQPIINEHSRYIYL